jgi:glutaminyl-peptide cyclotransferase
LRGPKISMRPEIGPPVAERRATPDSVGSGDVPSRAMLRVLARWSPATWVLVLACATVTSTDPAPRPVGHGRFTSGTPTADSLLSRLHALMLLPRNLGDPRRDASIAALEAILLELGLDPVERLEHIASDPATGEGYALVSLIAHLRPQAPRRFVLATHFDTRPWADEEPDEADRAHPVPGANDGTSGLAIIVELVPVLARTLPAEVGMTVVLFDGEELGRPGHGGYCKGSRALARALLAGDFPAVARAELGIVLDMVGDTDLELLIEPSSLAAHPELVRHVWTTASAAGHAAFVPTVGPTTIIDDHTFLSEAGIPSILLIDYDYAHWHTRGDTPERVSGLSLQIVADVVLRSLDRWYANEPKARP